MAQEELNHKHLFASNSLTEGEGTAPHTHKLQFQWYWQAQFHIGTII